MRRTILKRIDISLFLYFTMMLVHLRYPKHDGWVNKWINKLILLCLEKRHSISPWNSEGKLRKLKIVKPKGMYLSKLLSPLITSSHMSKIININISKNQEEGKKMAATTAFFQNWTFIIYWCEKYLLPKYELPVQKHKGKKML